MTIHLRPKFPRLDPNAQGHEPVNWTSIRRFADFGIWVTLGLAILVLTDAGPDVFILLAISIVGLPLSILMYVAVPLAAVLVPWRVMFGAMKHRFTTKASALIAAVFAVLCASALDAAFKVGPDGRETARNIVASQSAVLPVRVPEDGIIGLRYDGEGSQWIGCSELCKTLLNDGTATHVVSYTSNYEPFQAFYIANSVGICRGADRAIRRSDTICETRYTDLQPSLMFDLLYRDAPTDQTDLSQIWDVTIHSGALTQRTKLVEANVTVGGGLIAPYWAGNLSGGYFSEPQTVTVLPDSVASLTSAEAWNQSMMVGYTALVLALLD